MITIELYGVARMRAGRGQLRLDVPTLGLACRELGSCHPNLAGSAVDGDRIGPACRVSLNGDRFVSDPATTLADGDVLIWLSADVGG